jgi:hypothetical protein
VAPFNKLSLYNIHKLDKTQGYFVLNWLFVIKFPTDEKAKKRGAMPQLMLPIIREGVTWISNRVCAGTHYLGGTGGQ